MLQIYGFIWNYHETLTIIFFVKSSTYNYSLEIDSCKSNFISSSFSALFEGKILSLHPKTRLIYDDRLDTLYFRSYHFTKLLD